MYTALTSLVYSAQYLYVNAILQRVPPLSALVYFWNHPSGILKVKQSQHTPVQAQRVSGG